MGDKTTKADKPAINWLDQPEEHDYPAAQSYLNLLYDDKKTADLVRRLREAPMAAFKAKDILRASGLSPLGMSNAHVEKDLKKIQSGTRISPLLLVRQDGQRTVVADGYHRLCALYSFDEDTTIPCKIV